MVSFDENKWIMKAVGSTFQLPVVMAAAGYHVEVGQCQNCTKVLYIGPGPIIYFIENLYLYISFKSQTCQLNLSPDLI
jgi:hypothetical protein